MPTVAGKKTTFPSISSLIGRAFSIFRQKTDGPNTSEMDIKIFIPAATYCLQLRYYEFPELRKQNNITKMEK